MGKVYIRFQTETAQKPFSLGRHIPTWLVEGSTPRALFLVILGIRDSIHRYPPK